MSTIHLDKEYNKGPPMSLRVFKPKKIPSRKGSPGSYYLANKDRMDKAKINAEKVRKKSLKGSKKACKANQIRNPNTNRCVKRTSKKGQQILKGTLPPKKKSRYVAKYGHLPVGSIIRLENGRCMEKRPDGRMVFTRLNKEDCANSQ